LRSRTTWHDRLLLGDARHGLRPVAASSEDAQTMELRQLQAAEGPCLEAYRTITQVRVPELDAAAQRWPTFAAAVANAGAYRSVHAIPMRLRGQAVGAMNLFHASPGRCPRRISRWRRHWPMWPPSGSCRSRRLTGRVM
jgi:GAF domain-containing protein